MFLLFWVVYLGFVSPNVASAAVGPCLFPGPTAATISTSVTQGDAIATTGHIIPTTGGVSWIRVRGNQTQWLLGKTGINYEGADQESCFHSYHSGAPTPATDFEIGIDIGTSGQNSSIVASLGGTVTFSGFNSAWGNYVEIKNTHGATERYAHMQSLPLVSLGQVVSQGQLLGNVGKTGDAGSGEHLHWTVLANSGGRNPFQQGCEAGGCGPAAQDAYWVAYLAGTPPPAPPPGPGTNGGGTTNPITLGPINLNVGYPTIPYPGGSFNLGERVASGNLEIADIVRFFFAVSLWIGGIIAFLTLVYAGFLYIFSGTNPGNRARAKDRLWAVLWGLGILFFATIILNFINPDITSLELQPIPEVRICSSPIDTSCLTQPTVPKAP